ncbi:hypothetical protein [Arthrobacter sp. NEB 688]|uniref:hypothetical protein n=1 Tax=Arthrobacter sp. NEB 688 TaxID=904039 RepID=UPI001564728D|nr:hypothetical protein [Arthrobacter sp. NEB 688]QKE84521.1 hypothetical protein HL663_11600 [Arthrobacter sp. NEB 688]
MATQPSPVRDAFAAGLPSGRAVLAGAWATAVVATLIALAQLDGLVAQVVTAGRTASLSGLTSVGAVLAPGTTDAAWARVATAATAVPGTARWVVAYALVDVVLVALYALGAGALLRAAATGTSPGRPWYAAALLLLGVGAAADLVESALLVDLTDGSGHPRALVVTSTVKWLGLLLAVLAVVLARRQHADTPRGPAHPTPYGPDDVRTPAGPVRRVLGALYTHRFSLLVVVPFGALGLASGTDVLDQLPDVQRQWVDSGPAWRALVSGVLTGLVAALVVVVGRLRSHHVAMRVLGAGTPPSAAPYRRPSLLPWFVTLAVVLVALLLSRLLLGRWDVIGVRLGIAVGIPLVVWAGSVWLRRGGGQVPWSPYRRPVTAQQAATTRVVGDVLGVLVLVIPGLGLVRAFAAPVALGNGGWNIGLLVLGVVGSVLTWPVARWLAGLVGRYAPDDLLTALVPGRVMGETSQRRSRLAGWGLLALGVALFTLLGLRPEATADRLGVIGVMLLAVTAVALPLGATVILLQGGGAPDLLSRPLTPVLRTAPVLTIVLLSGLVVGLTGSDARVHGLRTTTAAAPDPAARTGLGARLSTMLAQPGCSTALPGTSYRVRPLFLLAAEGGGIRAAAWTALGTDALADAGGACSEALVSSGASGGAVGLTVSAFADVGGQAFPAVERMAGPEALGSAVSGLLVRDPLRSVTGLAFPTSGERGWVDRAGLMERAWEQAVPGLRAPYLAAPRGRVTGALVLNSTSVATHCRTLLSQVGLDPAPDPRDCRTPTAVPDSVDLLATLRVGCSDRAPALRASTVALLASRFPYVTPSGVVTTGCPDGGTSPDAQQVVDGGYADNDGLGTLVDLAPRWLPTLRAHNAAVLDGRRDGALVLPVVVYLDNGQGSDLAADPAGATNEVLVPLLTKGSATAALSSTDTQLHRALAAFSTADLVPGCDDDTLAVCAAVEGWRGPAVKVFYQPTRPSLAAPLGWVLSDQSLRTLRCARDDQVAGSGLAPVARGDCDTAPAVAGEGLAPTAATDACTAADRDASPLSSRGYGTMRSALCLARAAGAGRTG